MPDRSKYDLSDGGFMPWWYHKHAELSELLLSLWLSRCCRNVELS
jgi:hypothetical protein